MARLPRLNLPPIGNEIRCNGESAEIYDPLRLKFVALTPEEWVRQHFTAWLIDGKRFPRSLIANEIGLKVNNRPRRADTVVYRPDLTPLMVVEYKQPNVAVTQKVFDQIVRYNMVYRAPFIVVSNGLSHYCCRIDFENHSYKYLTDIPEWDQLT